MIKPTANGIERADWQRRICGFARETGELTRALRRNRGDAKDKAALEGEFADVLAWLSTLASIAGVDLEGAALAKYEKGCPRCCAVPCKC